MTTATRSVRLQRARASLDGLATGDAFGEQFFRSADHARQLIGTRTVPTAPWQYTDDTAMALSIVDVLAECGAIDQDRLARLFGERFRADPARGYGRGAREILEDILESEEEHIDYLETQLGLIGELGLQNWLQSQAGSPSS